MNAVALLALVLGIIAVVVTLQQVKSYESLNQSVKALTHTVNRPKSVPSTPTVPKELLGLQKAMGLDDVSFLKYLEAHQDQLAQTLKNQTVTSTKEHFENFASNTFEGQSFPYLTANQRGFDELPSSLHYSSWIAPSTHVSQPSITSYEVDKNSVIQRMEIGPNYFDANRGTPYLYTDPTPFQPQTLEKRNWSDIQIQNQSSCQKESFVPSAPMAPSPYRHMAYASHSFK